MKHDRIKRLIIETIPIPFSRIPLHFASRNLGRASKSDLPRVPGTAGSDGSVLHQAKGFMQDIVGALREELTGHPTAGGVGGVAGTSGTTASKRKWILLFDFPQIDLLPEIPVAPAKSLPSEEPLGAKPGDRSAGVGALPGLSTETGVAVLPEEKSELSQFSTFSTVFTHIDVLRQCRLAIRCWRPSWRS
jgi:hypothetical protein